MHSWCKRNKFCRTRINKADIKYVSAVWNIVMADLNCFRGKFFLGKDSDNMKDCDICKTCLKSNAAKGACVIKRKVMFIDCC